MLKRIENYLFSECSTYKLVKIIISFGVVCGLLLSLLAAKCAFGYQIGEPITIPVEVTVKNSIMIDMNKNGEYVVNGLTLEEMGCTLVEYETTTEEGIVLNQDISC